MCATDNIICSSSFSYFCLLYLQYHSGCLSVCYFMYVHSSSYCLSICHLLCLFSSVQSPTHQFYHYPPFYLWTCLCYLTRVTRKYVVFCFVCLFLNPHKILKVKVILFLCRRTKSVMGRQISASCSEADYWSAG